MRSDRYLLDAEPFTYTMPCIATHASRPTLQQELASPPGDAPLKGAQGDPNIKNILRPQQEAFYPANGTDVSLHRARSRGLDWIYVVHVFRGKLHPA